MDVFGNLGSLTMKLKRWNSEVFDQIARRKLLAFRIYKVQTALDWRCSSLLLDLECNLCLECKVVDHWCYDSEVLQEEPVQYFSSLYSLGDQTLDLFPLYGCFPV